MKNLALSSSLRFSRLVAILAAAVFAQPAFATIATTPLNVTVPGSGTPFAFQNDSASGNDWPLFQCWDGITKCVVNPNGQASANNSAPVVLPAVQVTADLCTLLRKTTVPISTTSNLTLLVSGVALKTIYICSGMIKNSAATNISLVEGVGSTCATAPTAALAGVLSVSTTTGIPLGALGDGFKFGNGGAGDLAIANPGNALCLTQAPASGSVLLGGYISFVQSLL